jgi:protein-disulfide isomerase
MLKDAMRFLISKRDSGGRSGIGRGATALLLSVALSVAALLVVSGMASRGSAGGADAELSPQQVEQIEGVIREYLLNNPEILVEAMRELERRQRAMAADQARAAITARQEELINDPDSPVGGNPEGDVTLVEFFDYQCPYCRAVAPDVNRLVDGDDGVRVVYKEFPILGPLSHYAARAALAAHRQEQYEPFHHALMGEPDRLSEERVLAIAADVGLDLDRLRRDMDDPGIAAALDRTRELASALGINGTPAFVVGEEIVPGAIGLDEMRELVRRAREEG